MMNEVISRVVMRSAQQSELFANLQIFKNNVSAEFPRGDNNSEIYFMLSFTFKTKGQILRLSHYYFSDKEFW